MSFVIICDHTHQQKDDVEVSLDAASSNTPHSKGSIASLADILASFANA